MRPVAQKGLLPGLEPSPDAQNRLLTGDHPLLTFKMVF